MGDVRNDTDRVVWPGLAERGALTLFLLTDDDSRDRALQDGLQNKVLRAIVDGIPALILAPSDDDARSLGGIVMDTGVAWHLRRAGHGARLLDLTRRLDLVRVDRETGAVIEIANAIEDLSAAIEATSPRLIVASGAGGLVGGLERGQPVPRRAVEALVEIFKRLAREHDCAVGLVIAGRVLASEVWRRTLLHRWGDDPGFHILTRRSERFADPVRFGLAEGDAIGGERMVVEVVRTCDLESGEEGYTSPKLTSRLEPS